MTWVHFFKPLLPEFIPGVDIPVNFFSKHIEGKTDLTTVELRTEVSDPRPWWVKLEGRRLTKGWKEFAEAHNYQVGDIIVFRDIGDLTFIMFGFGRSCCEIQYQSSNNRCDDTDEEEVEKITSEYIGFVATVKSEPISPDAVAGSEDRFLSLAVTKDTLKRSRIFLSKDFVTINGLECFAGETISLMNEGGVKWPVKLVMEYGYTRRRMR